MLSSRFQHDLLSPRDAIASRWGRDRVTSFEITDSPEYIEQPPQNAEWKKTEDCIDIGTQTMADFTIKLESEPPRFTFEFEPRISSCSSSYTSQKSNSSWSVQSFLTTITSSGGSRRSSWTDPAKSSGTRTSTLSLHSCFNDLPPEVLNCIIEQLRLIHEHPNSSTCSICFNNDAFNLALVNRKWDKIVRKELYRYIHLDGAEKAAARPRSRLPTRIKLLRRTLRDQPMLAKLVQELRIWVPDKVLKEDMLDQVASIVRACPNLQNFSGQQSLYSYEFSRLHEALARRKYLKSHLWIIGEANILDTDLPEQTTYFVDLHKSWQHLSILALRCQRGASLAGGVIPAIVKQLSSLTHLSLSGFPEESFDDDALISIRALKALRLVDVPGITDKGLTCFSSSKAAQVLSSLTLTRLSIRSLYTISRLLSNLNLTTFKLTQYRPLVLPIEDIILQPFLASRNLESLYWDVPSGALQTSLASEHLILSLQNHGFPKLRRLRAPTDTYEGHIQANCKPQLPSNEDISVLCHEIGGTTVRAARLRSQARKSAALRNEIGSAITIRVSDPDQNVCYESEARWFGHVGHDLNIDYILHSDVGPWEHRKFLAEEGDLLGDVLDKNYRRCHGTTRSKHIGEPRWEGIDIEQLF